MSPVFLLDGGVWLLPVGFGEFPEAAVCVGMRQIPGDTPCRTMAQTGGNDNRHLVSPFT
jgi:hypothetical protein